jgi:hypothetical protein
MSINKISKLVAASATVFSLVVPSLKAQSFDVYIGGPDEQSSSHAGVVTETFESFAPGVQSGNLASTALASFGGTYNFTGNSGAIVAAGDYTGAGGTGLSLAQGDFWTSNTNTYSLNLTTDATYLGFWWSAGDAFNFIQFYDNGVLQANFTSADIFAVVQGGGTVTTVNNTIYNKSEYFGNPNNGANSSEPYAFVSIYATAGTVYDQVVFGNGNGLTGFESDNHTLFSGPLTPTGTEVFVSTITPIPEANATVLLFAVPSLMFALRRRSALRAR